MGLFSKIKNMFKSNEVEKEEAIELDEKEEIEESTEVVEKDIVEEKTVEKKEERGMVRCPNLVLIAIIILLI